jgi:hypothetical protein
MRNLALFCVATLVTLAIANLPACGDGDSYSMPPPEPDSEDMVVGSDSDPGKDDTEKTDIDDSDENTSGDSDEQVFPHDPNRPADSSQGIGEYCFSNVQCASKLCLSYRQVTPDPDGHCEESSTPSKIVAIGTTIDFETRKPVSEANIKFLGATNLTLLRCNATASDTLVTGADGRFKKAVDKPAAEPVGFIALASQGKDYAPSASGIADPPWPKGTIRHDILMVKNSALTKWSQLLSADSEMKPYMNLSANGGAIGAILDVDTGKPIIGATLGPASGGTTSAKIRYLNAGGTGFVKDGITQSGIFVLVNPALAEKFDVFLDGKKINITTAKFGDTKCVVFIVDIPIEADEKGIDL